MKTRKFRPYVRLANGREHASSFRDAFRLAFYQQLGKPFYVMVQHGVPNRVMAIGASKRDVQRQPLGAHKSRGGFKAWSKRLQLRALGKEVVQ